MATFDFRALLNDPAFQFGTSLLLNGRQPGAVGNAYGILQQSQQRQQQAQQQQQQMEMQRQELEATKAWRQAQAENFVRQAEMQKQEMTLAAQRMQRQQQEADLAVRAEERRREMQEKFMEQLGSAGMFGPTLPAPERSVEPTTLPGAPAAKGAKGRYGTPAALLDNLEQVESSGNPRAVNKTSGAMGAYQFMPATVDMFRKQGKNFDPFDREQSRDMADQYIQELVQQHGGDYRKALAAYGGFKTKDPTPYVNKVMSGIEPARPAAATGTPAAATPHRGLELARLGVMGEVAGIKGAGKLVDIGKMMEPNTVPAGSYREDPVTGKTTFVGDPYKERDQALAERKFGIDSAKAERELQKSDKEVVAKRANDEATFTNVDSSMERMEKAVAKLEKHPGLKYNTGAYGAVRAYQIPRTAGKDASVIIESLKSKMVIETVKELKAASATGATGFGSITDRENERFETMIANLDRSQTEESFRDQLKEIRGFIKDIRQRARTEYRSVYGTDPKRGNDAPPANGKSGVKFLGYE